MEVTTVPSLKIGSSNLAKVKLYICRNLIYGNVCVYVCVSSVNKIGFWLSSVCNLFTVSLHPSPSSLPRVQHSSECPCPEQNFSDMFPAGRRPYFQAWHQTFYDSNSFAYTSHFHCTWLCIKHTSVPSTLYCYLECLTSSPDPCISKANACPTCPVKLWLLGLNLLLPSLV